MLYDMKQALYRAGHFTLNQSPTTATWHWDEEQWIHWIDNHGEWNQPTANEPSDTLRAFGHDWVKDPTTGKHRLKQSA